MTLPTSNVSKLKNWNARIRIQFWLALMVCWCQAVSECVELKASSEAYRDIVVAAAIGQTGLFKAILREYLLAPEVTSRRLYLETMEEILPKAEKIVLEPGTTNLVPYLPLAPAARPVGSLGRPAFSTKAEKGAAE